MFLEEGPFRSSGIEVGNSKALNRRVRLRKLARLRNPASQSHPPEGKTPGPCLVLPLTYHMCHIITKSRNMQHQPLFLHPSPKANTHTTYFTEFL